MPKSAAILIIGNEVLSGKVADQNGPYLTRELRALGVDVRRISIIPDEAPTIAEEVRRLAGAYDLVFTTGGVGPTHDDVTMAAVAEAFARPLVRHPALEAILRQHFGVDITPAELRMAEIPGGGRLIGEGNLAFPVVAVQNVYIFPGIPETVRRKFARIREQFRDRPFVLRRVFLRCEEGEIAEELRAVLDRFPDLQLGSYPIVDEADHTVLLTLESLVGDEVERALGFLLERLPHGSLVRVE
jgi:molybdenum cofactor synthesis domain-containing protein